MGIRAETLIEAARERGIALDESRAERLVPPLESLRSRLARLAESLPRDVTPPPARWPETR
jgi:hypothetical protein